MGFCFDCNGFSIAAETWKFPRQKISGFASFTLESVFSFYSASFIEDSFTLKVLSGPSNNTNRCAYFRGYM